MREHPILFSGEMVRAILEGRKTQTRRVIKCPRSTGAFVLVGTNENTWWPYVSPDGESPVDDRGNETPMHYPYGQPGDCIYVKETHYRFGHWETHGFLESGRPEWIFVAENNEVYYPDNPPPNIVKGRSAHGWFKRPSLFMPRWASRITLEIVSVRVERLQEISEADAKAEGLWADKPRTWWQGYRDWDLRDGRHDLLFQQHEGENPPDWMIEPHRMADRPDLLTTAATRYRYLWDSINGKSHPWGNNDWVWVIEFKRIV